MKVKLTTRSDKSLAENDYRDLFKIDAGSLSLCFCDGEPEDNLIGRNFSDVFKIEELIKMAHEAGLKGESLEFEEAEK